MQKKIIALAIAGLASTAAFAQSNVTVYGIVDSYMANIGSAGNTVTAVNSGGLAGSRLGFKGVEDLGGGTKALFTIEHALAVDSDVAYAAATSARQAFVGLSGAYGTVIGGRLQTMVYNHNAAFNPVFGTAVDTLAAVSATNGTTVAIGTAERLNNAVAYVAPAIGGLTISAAYTANAAATEAVTGYQDSTRAGEVAAMYVSGPLTLGFVDRYVQDRGASGNNSIGFGAGYDFGIAKLTAQTAQQINNQDGAAGTSATDTKYTMTQYGAVVPVSANGAVIASVAQNKFADGKSWSAQALVYKHSLSKRTSLYGGIASNAAAGGTAASTNSATLAGVTSTAGGDDNRVSAVLAGINHSF